MRLTHMLQSKDLWKVKISMGKFCGEPNRKVVWKHKVEVI